MMPIGNSSNRTTQFGIVVTTRVNVYSSLTKKKEMFPVYSSIDDTSLSCRK